MSPFKITPDALAAQIEAAMQPQPPEDLADAQYAADQVAAAGKMIRFDPATGRLEGTDLMSVAEVVEAYEVHDVRPLQGKLFARVNGEACACLLGLHAIHRLPSGFDRVRDFYFTSEAATALGLDPLVGEAVAWGFDGGSPVECLRVDRPAAEYGAAVAAALGLNDADA